MNKNTLKKWVDKFHKDGYLLISDVLPQDKCWLLIDEYQQRKRKCSSKIQKRMFEDSPENLTLFNIDPIASFAKALIGNTTEWDNLKIIDKGNFLEINPSHVSDAVHVFHNNSFETKAGAEGLGASQWHQDDTPHIFSTNGKPLPDYIRLNVMAFTVMFYLTDVTSPENGPTQVVPGSHRYGLSCPPDLTGTKHKIVSCLGKVGTAVCFNNQVWHRGSKNSSNQNRMITQVSYGKRLVGHKYGDFMNYEMPEHVYEDADAELKQLLGFLPHGPYG